MIDPVRVAKGDRAVVHGVGSHGHPDTIGQIRAAYFRELLSLPLGA